MDSKLVFRSLLFLLIVLPLFSCFTKKLVIRGTIANIENTKITASIDGFNTDSIKVIEVANIRNGEFKISNINFKPPYSISFEINDTIKFYYWVSNYDSKRIHLDARNPKKIKSFDSSFNDQVEKLEKQYSKKYLVGLDEYKQVVKSAEEKLRLRQELSKIEKKTYKHARNNIENAYKNMIESIITELNSTENLNLKAAFVSKYFLSLNKKQKEKLKEIAKSKFKNTGLVWQLTY